MGLAWVPDDKRRAVGSSSPRDLTSGPRHRRPTLLARSGQAVACKITALARTDPDARPSPSAHPSRRPVVTVRRYWT